MKLTIIIVNYNVRYFLEQCLYSVMKAATRIPCEIFVVDNNSVDNSAAMVKEKFPEVILIENKVNTGFSKANNQAIRIAKGEYILLLNPDTLVEEDTFLKVVEFMDAHPDAGGLGVYMIDGKGNYLPESKRGLPTPEVAFYKIFGFSKLFPTSKRFGKYHLGYLDKNETHEVDVLSGAFMLLRKSALDKAGLLDEDFFMYGEDIDLSYRLIKAGYKNYYYPGTKIIHYKGESTKKSSVNYVRVFYKAMSIFAKKHFSEKRAGSLTTLINLAIYLRASGALIITILKRIALPLLDSIIIFSGLLFLKYYWENVVKASEGLRFETEVLTIAFPVYVVIWICCIYFSGGYDKPLKISKIVKGLAIGSLIILTSYALLSEEHRFSRALVLLGAAWSTLSIVGIRLLFNALHIKGFEFEAENNKKIIIVGSADEYKRVMSLLNLSGVAPSFAGHVTITENRLHTDDSLGSIARLNDMVEIYKIDEIIFCAKDIPAQDIMNQMAHIGSANVDFKIAPPESLYIIGSNSVNTSGELYVVDINSITKPANKRNKKLLDILVSCFLLVTYPINIFIIKSPFSAIKNIYNVLLGGRSWVGYINTGNLADLPPIKKGILNPADALKNIKIDLTNKQKLNQLYAKDYSTTNDLAIIIKKYRDLGRKVNI